MARNKNKKLKDGTAPAARQGGNSGASSNDSSPKEGAESPLASTSGPGVRGEGKDAPIVPPKEETSQPKVEESEKNQEQPSLVVTGEGDGGGRVGVGEGAGGDGVGGVGGGVGVDGEGSDSKGKDPLESEPELEKTEQQKEGG